MLLWFAASACVSLVSLGRQSSSSLILWERWWDVLILAKLPPTRLNHKNHYPHCQNKLHLDNIAAALVEKANPRMCWIHFHASCMHTVIFHSSLSVNIAQAWNYKVVLCKAYGWLIASWRRGYSEWWGALIGSFFFFFMFLLVSKGSCADCSFLLCVPERAVCDQNSPSSLPVMYLLVRLPAPHHKQMLCSCHPPCWRRDALTNVKQRHYCSRVAAFCYKCCHS